MPATTGHEVFQEPSNPDIKIWRYMDFAKYMSLLNSGGLYFSRSDLLGDPFEGSVSKATVALRWAYYRPHFQELSDEQFNRLYSKEWTRQWTFVNCWHMNEGESAAMWSLYAKTNEAIAVRSTYTRLRDCLPSCAFVGEVRYIDYETEPIPIDNSFWPYVHKRKSYEHERELRAVIREYPPPPIEYDPADVAAARTFVPKGYPSVTDQINTERGRLVQLSIDELVEAVYVAPSAPTWFRDLVAAVTAKYGFGDKEVNHSSLDTGPLH